MNKKMLAKELVKIAQTLVGMEFDTEEAMKEYLKEHPDADKSLHHVKKEDKKQEGHEKTKPSKTEFKNWKEIHQHMYKNNKEEFSGETVKVKGKEIKIKSPSKMRFKTVDEFKKHVTKHPDEDFYTSKNKIKIEELMSDTEKLKDSLDHLVKHMPETI